MRVGACQFNQKKIVDDRESEKGRIEEGDSKKSPASIMAEEMA